MHVMPDMAYTFPVMLAFAYTTDSPPDPLIRCTSYNIFKLFSPVGSKTFTRIYLGVSMKWSVYHLTTLEQIL